MFLSKVCQGTLICVEIFPANVFYFLNSLIWLAGGKVPRSWPGQPPAWPGDVDEDHGSSPSDPGKARKGGWPVSLRCLFVFIATCLSYFHVVLQACLSEIHSNMWVRNGLQIKGQAMTYVQSHFCNSMIDPDIYLLQVCVFAAQKVAFTRLNHTLPFFSFLYNFFPGVCIKAGSWLLHLKCFWEVWAASLATIFQ